MGYGKLRKVSTISKKISTTTNFQTTSTDPVSAAKPDGNEQDSSATTDDLKRRRSSARRSIYSIADDYSLEASNTGKPVPPDGGYGWVIVMAIHFIQATGIGFLTSLGIFYIEWRKYFDSSAAETGLVVSLSSVVMGVIRNVLITIEETAVDHRHIIIISDHRPLTVGVAGIVGPRPLVMTGSFVVFIGLLATSFATSITQLMFTVGVVTAFGYGMICSPSILIIGDYFENNYGLATGIAFAGTSMGQLIFPPLSVEFIYWFGGWKGAMFIFSALLLNIAVFGALLRPLTKSKPTVDKKQFTSACTPTTYQNAGFEEDSNRLDNIPSTSYDKHAREITPLENQNELPILNMIVCDDWIVPYLDSNPKQPKSRTNELKKYQKKIKGIMKNLIHFLAKSYGIPGVFQSPLFVMMIPAIICQGIGWFTTVTHQAARAISVGISEEDASFLLSLMGIGSLVGRVTHGWFIDRGFITSEMCFVFSLGVCSVSTYLISFVNHFPVLAVLATIQGMTSGIGNTLIVVVIKTFVKPNFEDAAVGMLFLVWGFGDLIGGVVAGYLYDSTGDYNVSFYFAGSAIAVSTIIVYLTCVLKDRIVAKLYQNLELQKLEKGGNSTDRLDDIDTSAEGYDNEVFEMDTEDEMKANVDNCAGVDEQSADNVRPVFKIEIHDTWDRARIVQDTNV